MRLENLVCGSRRLLVMLMAASFLLIITGSASLASAQTAAASQTDQELSVSDLLKLPEKLSAKALITARPESTK